MVRQRLILFSSVVLMLSGCASGTFKARQEQREKMADSSGMFCEFVSGDLFPDLDVELSMQMARRCDSSKNFSISNYKNSSGQSGVIYCCSTVSKAEKKVSAPVPAKPPATPVKSEGAPAEQAEGASE